MFTGLTHYSELYCKTMLQEKEEKKATRLHKKH